MGILSRLFKKKKKSGQQGETTANEREVDEQNNNDYNTQEQFAQQQSEKTKDKPEKKESQSSTTDNTEAIAAARSHTRAHQKEKAKKQRELQEADETEEKQHSEDTGNKGNAEQRMRESEEAPADNNNNNESDSNQKMTDAWPEDEMDDPEVFLDSPEVMISYSSIPVLEETKLPRGGVSVETKAVGRVQFGIPPETIKCSMSQGIPVPQVYIVPMERFCREMGPALGVNLAEFEFPAYFNFFVYKKQCTLIVDSADAEDKIRRVFAETLLGPQQFRREDNPITYEEEDFAPEFPRDAIPNFEKEFRHFRIMPGGKELDVDLLIKFKHFEEHNENDLIGVTPPIGDDDDDVEPLKDDDEAKDSAEKEGKMTWSYAQAKYCSDVATIWPPSATPEQIKNRSVPRVEIFKLSGGTAYLIHDVDENNIIVGKARLHGHVRVSEYMSVEGFGGRSILDDLQGEVEKKKKQVASKISRDTFHPPSFGVTVLGNSHGFDKKGSVSGYVLWINGRGVMIDPPPYSSATLEREGIRRRTIVGIIITHCHADHDAGAFQKVLTGTPVVVITTPTIYKSFIRKYAALSSLSPALLRHSHRFKPAIIGQPLRFQGATFHFTYSLHTIPCIGFKVEWRGKSIVFTGDHFNNPPAIDKLTTSGVLSEGRRDDLTNLSMQECDVLLHEAGAPPIHTPLDVLIAMPPHVKKRMYIVHTSALPEGCDLRVAPTGTARTIRLDNSSDVHMDSTSSLLEDPSASHNEYHIGSVKEECDAAASLAASSQVADDGTQRPRNSICVNDIHAAIPLVSLRPASSTDAWFILNLLSAVPFLSSLSYASAMEVLEIAKVDAYATDSVVIPASRRSKVLCVVWEGSCAERHGSKGAPLLRTIEEDDDDEDEDGKKGEHTAVWYAGDWTGPLQLQPDLKLSGESASSKTYDVIAHANVGAKVITIDFASLHMIMKNGSPLYRRYLDRKKVEERARADLLKTMVGDETEELINEAVKDLNVLELLNCNSALRKLTAVQKRHLESLAEGPVNYKPKERMWQSGAPVEKAFIIVSGTASFLVGRRTSLVSSTRNSSGENMRSAANAAAKELEKEDASEEMEMPTPLARQVSAGIFSEGVDLESIQKGLAKRAAFFNKGEFVEPVEEREEADDSLDTENESAHIDYTDGGAMSKRTSVIKRRFSRARQVNLALGRLFSRKAFAGDLVFSKGHFLGDVSKMVAGLLADEDRFEPEDDGPDYGLGEKAESKKENDTNVLSTISEGTNGQAGEYVVTHSSTLVAGSDGCVVLEFPKANLIPFLDQYPGFLLSLLGTQVIV